jgi:hypothetical protein
MISWTGVQMSENLSQAVMAKTNPHRGLAFEDFLKEEGLLERATATAMKRVGPMKRVGKREPK